MMALASMIARVLAARPHFHSGLEAPDPHPVMMAGVAITLLVLVVVVGIFWNRYVNDGLRIPPPKPPPDPEPARVELAALYAADPTFSRPAFEQLAAKLYVDAQHARGDAARVDALAAQLSADMHAVLATRSTPVSKIAVGALRITHVTQTTAPLDGIALSSDDPDAAPATAEPARVRVELELEATHAEGDDAEPVAVHDRFVLTRVAGRDAWIIEQLDTLASQPLADPTAISARDPMRGPRPLDPTRTERFAALRADDLALTWDAIVERTKHVQARIDFALNRREIGPIRELVTPAALDQLRFQRLARTARTPGDAQLDHAIRHVELVDVTRDSQLDAIVVRSFADALTYALAADGHLLAGSSHTHDETQYWTLIRVAGQHDAPWLLAKIEAYDAYQG